MPTRHCWIAFSFIGFTSFRLLMVQIYIAYFFGSFTFLPFYYLKFVHKCSCWWYIKVKDKHILGNPDFRITINRSSIWHLFQWAVKMLPLNLLTVGWSSGLSITQRYAALILLFVSIKQVDFSKRESSFDSYSSRDSILKATVNFLYTFK